MAKKVIASERGYYGQIREAGDIFDVPDTEEASPWFSDFKPKKPAKADAAKTDDELV